MVQGSVDQGNADEENILKDLENSNKSREFPQVLKIYFAAESLRNGCRDERDQEQKDLPTGQIMRIMTTFHAYEG